jgi:LytS/YehU family sensor histidine kinase
LSSKKVITLQEEITYLESYLKLEQERFAGKFHFEIIADPALKLSETMLPSMLIQPLVENAVKHGLSPLEGTDGMLRVLFSKVGENTLRCIIEDNGIGLERSLAQKRETSTRLSKALSITQRRIELFSKTSKTGTYSVTERQE